MDAGLIQPALNLGVAGFSILVMWWMYQSAANERKENDIRLDKKDEAFRALEKEVRTEISAALITSTTTIRDNVAIMQRLVEKVGEAK